MPGAGRRSAWERFYFWNFFMYMTAATMLMQDTTPMTVAEVAHDEASTTIPTIVGPISVPTFCPRMTTATAAPTVFLEVATSGTSA